MGAVEMVKAANGERENPALKKKNLTFSFVLKYV